MFRRGLLRAIGYSDAFYSLPTIPSCQTCKYFMPNRLMNDELIIQSDIEGYCRKNDYKSIIDCRAQESLCGKHGDHYEEAPTPFIIILSIITGAVGAIVYQKLN